MFLLLDTSRTQIAEITDYLSVTINIRFSSPGLLDMTISETSDIAGLITELMHVYHVETKTLFLIDFIQRDKVYADAKAVIVKGNTIEGFFEQRVIHTDKLLDGSNLQASIKALIEEQIISPVDVTRTVDFYRFEDSVDPKVTSQNVKGLVSGITLMNAITSLLESKNLGYEIMYDLNTKLATFKIVAGRNLCAGFTSVVHGSNLPQTVTLSSASETLKDIKSIIDLAPYKTRVYVRNFDELKIFDRGTTATGINLREGFLSTGHGNAFAVIPEVPPIPPIVIPPQIIPEVIIPETMPETNLIGLYVLTNKERLIACAFYPGLPIPEVWYDVTPDQVNGANVSISPTGSKVTLTDGDLIFASANRKKLYRSSMVGGWLGSRYFTQAVPIFDVETVDVAADVTNLPRTHNSLGSFGVDVYSGQVAGTVVSYDVDIPWPWGTGHQARLFDGTAYGLDMVTATLSLPIAYPAVDMGLLNINNDLITLSGINGTMAARLTQFNGAAWEVLGTTAPGGFATTWHARPEFGNDVLYCTPVVDAVQSDVYRTKDLFANDPPEVVRLPERINPLSGGFSHDGRALVTIGAYSRFCVTKFPIGDLAGTTTDYYPFPFSHYAANAVGLSSAGTDKLTGKNRWGYMTTGRSPSIDDGNNVTPAYYITDDYTFDKVTNMTPLLKTYLANGPYGVHENGLLLEWPIHAWPVLG